MVKWIVNRVWGGRLVWSCLFVIVMLLFSNCHCKFTVSVRIVLSGVKTAALPIALAVLLLIMHILFQVY